MVFIPGFGIGMTLANFQIDGKSPVSQMSFMRSKRTWSDGHDTLTSEQDISNKLGQTFSKNSSTENYHPEFQKFKKQKEKTKLNFISVRNGLY
jgi:hypothetical protein